MSMFRFTGQPPSGVPQRPYLLSPQLSLTTSPPCFIMQPPPPNRVIGPFRVDSPVPVSLRHPPPTGLYAPVPASAVADNPCFPQFKPDCAYFVPASTSQRPVVSVSNSTATRSPQLSQRSSFALQSTCSADVRKANDVACKQSAADGNKTDSGRPSPQPTSANSSPVPLFRLPTMNSSIIAPSSTGASSAASCGVAVSLSAAGHEEETTDSRRRRRKNQWSTCGQGPSATPTISTSSLVSTLSMSAPVFVPHPSDGSDHLPAAECWQSSPAAAAVVDSPESETETRGKTCDSDAVNRVTDGIVQCPRSESTASSLPSASSLLSPVAANIDGKSSSTIGRGRKLLIALTSRPGVGGVLLYLHALFLSIACMRLFITFRVSHRQRKMYNCHGVCLCVCLFVAHRIPTLLHGPGCNLGMVGVPSSCALFHGFAISARVSLL